MSGEGGAAVVSAPSTDTGSTTPTTETESQTDDRAHDSTDKTDKSEPKKEKKPLPPAPKKRKVVIDGKEEHVDEDQVFRDYQKYRSADNEKRAVAEEKKRIAEFYRLLEENPEEILKHPKFSAAAKKLAREQMEAEIDNELKDPKDLELEQLRAEKEARDAKDAKEKKDRETRELKEAVEKQKEEIGGVLRKVMEGTVIAKDAAALRAAAYYMRQAIIQNQDVTPEEIVEHIESHMLNNYRSTANQYSGEELVKFLGDDVVAKIRDYDMTQLKAKRAAKQQSNPQTGGEPRVKTPQTFDRYGASEFVRKKLGL